MLILGKIWSSVVSQAFLPPPRVHAPLPWDLSDKELFEKFCLPHISDDTWEDDTGLNIRQNQSCILLILVDDKVIHTLRCANHIWPKNIPLFEQQPDKTAGLISIVDELLHHPACPI